MSWFAANVSGPWTASATWVSSSTNSGATTGSVPWATATTIPQPNDIVFLNGKTVTLPASNYDINVGGISAETGSANTFGTTNVLVGGNIVGAAAGTWIYNITASDSRGIVAGTITANSLAMFVPGVTGQTINISASKIDATKYTTTAQGVFDANKTVSTYNIVCDSIVGPGATNAGIIYVSSGTATLNIRGNITSSTAGAPIWLGAGSANITITGSIRQVVSPIIFYNADNIGGTINILGNIDPPTNANTNAAIVKGPNNGINIVGNINGGSVSPAIFFSNANATTGITITGNVTAGSGATGIFSTSSLVTVYGTLTNTNGYMAVIATRLRVTGSTTWTVQNLAGANTNLTATSFAAGTFPAATDVRLGIDNGNGATGQIVIPSRNDVRIGVPVDDGIGTGATTTGLMVVPSPNDVRKNVFVNTASISGVQATGSMIVPTVSQVRLGVLVDSGSGTFQGISDFWNFATSSITTPGSIGALITSSLNVKAGSITGSFIAELDNTSSTSPTVKRLQNTSTVGTTGDQLSSYNT